MTTNKTGMAIVTVADVEQYNADFPPSGLSAFAAWLQDRIAEIPPEYRDSSEIDFGYTYGYDDDVWVTLKIWYERPETPEEASEKARAVAEAAAKREAYERDLYSILKVKYGSPEENHV